ncbi:MAG: sugar phosphate isomerase/epimerase [Gemmatimonadota bacterium]
MIDRRDFLKSSAALLAAAQLPRPVTSLLGGSANLDKIGVQLYTLRHEMERDFEATLRRVAEVGFQEVEFAGYFGHTPKQVHDLLAELKLNSPSAHMPYESLETNWQEILDQAREIGHQYALIAWTPEEERKTLDDWKRIADKFNRAGEAARRAGLKFGYHNHNFEFTPIDGKVPFDVLLAETDPALVKIEMDLYWITLAGGDPLVYFRQQPGRFPLVHVKDMKKGPPPRMVDVGAGDINFKAIFARHEQAGIQHYFVEHDEPADPWASIAASYRYLRGLEF